MMNAEKLLRRLRQIATEVRISLSPSAGVDLHLIELLDAARRAELPRIELADVLRSVSGERPAGQVLMHSLLRGRGSGSTAEMAALAAMTAAMQPKRILEFGTFDGASSWHLLANAAEDCSLTTIDLAAGAKVEGSSDNQLQGAAGARPFLPNDPRVRLVEIDSRHWIPDVSEVDLCFIDGGHSYECAKNDSEKAFRVTRPGGLIVWHDAAWRHDNYGVNRYLKELRATGRDVRLLRVGAYDYCGMAVLVM